MTMTTANSPAVTATARPALSFWARVQTAFGVHRQRRHLSRLDDAALNDIGVSRAEMEKEVGRPIWDLPSNRGS